MKCGAESEAENGKGKVVGEGWPEFRRDGGDWENRGGCSCAQVAGGCSLQERIRENLDLGFF